MKRRRLASICLIRPVSDGSTGRRSTPAIALEPRDLPLPRTTTSTWPPTTTASSPSQNPGYGWEPAHWVEDPYGRWRLIPGRWVPAQ